MKRWKTQRWLAVVVVTYVTALGLGCDERDGMGPVTNIQPEPEPGVAPPPDDPGGRVTPHGPGLEPPQTGDLGGAPAMAQARDAAPPAGSQPVSDPSQEGDVDAPGADQAPAEMAVPTGPDAGMPFDDATDDSGPATKPIDPPIPDECITDVSAGDHSFTCGSVTFLVLVSETCTEFACGLIFDIHGGTMGGAQMRDNTLLHELAPQEGYIVVHPSAGPGNTSNSWSQDEQAPEVADFMQRMIAAFHVDQRRVHITGFSQGSVMTFYFLCKHNDLLASAAPVAGAASTAACIDADWLPRVPVLYMNGTGDTASTIERSREMVDNVVMGLSLAGGEEVDSGPGHTRVHYDHPDGMEFDYIEHEYGGQAVLGGHCLPGGVDNASGSNNFGLNATTCTTGPEPRLHWGKTLLQWFMDHPKR